MADEPKAPSTLAKKIERALCRRLDIGRRASPFKFHRVPFGYIARIVDLEIAKFVKEVNKKKEDDAKKEDEKKDDQKKADGGKKEGGKK